MKTANAIRTFMNRPGNRSDMIYSKVTVSELKELKEASTSEEWTDYGRVACEAMGVEHEA
jgi:hypothetical protein